MVSPTQAKSQGENNEPSDFRIVVDERVEQERAVLGELIGLEKHLKHLLAHALFALEPRARAVQTVGACSTSAGD